MQVALQYIESLARIRECSLCRQRGEPTLPNTVCLLSSHGHAAVVVMKNLQVSYSLVYSWLGESVLAQQYGVLVEETQAEHIPAQLLVSVY